jgi:hypothetical protein
LSESHWIGRGTPAVPKRRSTLSSIESRIISPLMPPVSRTKP